MLFQMLVIFKLLVLALSLFGCVFQIRLGREFKVKLCDDEVIQLACSLDMYYMISFQLFVHCSIMCIMSK